MRISAAKVAISFLLFVILYIPVDFAFGILRNRTPTTTAAASPDKPAEPSTGVRAAQDAYHHGMAPLRKSQERWGDSDYVLTTNSLGFKDSETRDVSLETDRYRIVFIGDSFTEGIGYPYDLTFVGQIDKALTDQGIEVLNAGVVSYSPKLMFLKLDHLLRVVGLRCNELAMFIDCSDAIDEIDYSKIRFEELKERGLVPENMEFAELHKGPQHWYEYSLLYRTVARTLFKADPWKRITYVNRSTGREFAHYGQRSDWAHDQGLFESWANEGLESAAFYVSKIRALGEEFGFKMSICIYPWPKEIRLGKDYSLNVQFWTYYCKKHDVPIIDLYPAFTTGLPPKEIVNAFFIPEDSHWNEAGHRHVAEQWLAQRQNNTAPLGPLPSGP
jgi:hypothetical protein